MVILTAWNKKDIKTISESGLFDAEFYTHDNTDAQQSGLDPVVHYVLSGVKDARNPNENFNTVIYYNLYRNVIGQNENPFAHYIRNNNHLMFFEKGLLQDYSYETITKLITRFRTYPFFDPDDYIRMNSDLSTAHIPALQHAVLYGIAEGREVFSKRAIVRFLGNACKKPLDYTLSGAEKISAGPQSIGVFHHSAGNSFIVELAECLVGYLRDSGLNATVMTEKTAAADAPDLCIFCAPHEFFFLDGNETWKRDEIIQKSIMFNTEQPQTVWFTRGILYILMSAGVMDLCHQNLDGFALSGLPVFHFDPPLKPQACRLLAADRTHPLFRVLPKAARQGSSPFTPFAERSIDISFFGNASARRERFFARAARFFSDYRCFFYYRKADGPIPSTGAYDILSRLPRLVAENSKIALNIHRDDNCFFEWHRIVVQGMASGAVVVTEDCFAHPLYKSGVHFLAESPRHIPNLVEWLVRTPDGQETASRIQANMFAVLQDQAIAQSKTRDLRRYVSSVWSAVQ
ncbi:hypothetical protein K2X14_07045 [Acetobacter sp. TBRC 12305]|uniref:Uncharacterized protein n=1 Tax=Acetobacter garciniae TaxID=2817435 RepID=A0A939HLE6_9PROT|nr:hypothetical protein [Acetobacter garciniae]MBO1324900.1 hypothetical protein [Acetobacter garciniae]MBX0344591.1 hypothetical protein [Acetobacter garciniae]